MTHSAIPNSTSEPDLGYGQLFAILLRRRFWVIGMVCIALAVATYKNLTAKPMYESSMQLLVEPFYKGGNNQFVEVDSSVDLATQLKLMQTSNVFQQAVDLLSTDYPFINAGELSSSLAIARDKGKDDAASKIIQLSYKSDDPVKTQKVLQTIKKVYLDFNAAQQEARLKKGLAFIDAQLPKVREKIAKAQNDLDRFRQSHNLLDPGQRVATLTTIINDMEGQERTSRIAYQEAQSRYNTLRSQLTIPLDVGRISSRLSQSPRYQTLLNEIQKIEFTLASQRLRLTDTNPAIQILEAQRQSQLQLLQEEMARVLGQNANQLTEDQKALLRQGSLNTTDIELFRQLTALQVDLSVMQTRLQGLAQKKQQLQTELKQLPVLLTAYDQLQPKIKIEQDALQELLKARQQLSLEIAKGGFDWQVVEEPQLGNQVGNDEKRNLLLGVVVGLMLGGIAAFVREMLDDTVHTSDQLEKQFALPLLGMTPQFVQFEDGDTPAIKWNFRKSQPVTPLSLHVFQWLPLRESLDLIYKNIQLLHNDSPLRSLAITSALTGEGKSTLALGLAISAARSHQKVLLVDANLRSPTLHKPLNLANDRGLSTLLSDEEMMLSDQCIQKVGSYVDILTAGPIPSDSVQLLSSRRMQELMLGLEQTYDLVVIDTPSVLGTVDTIQTASFCDGVVLVGRIDKVTRTEFTQATDRLKKLNLIGVVANGVNNTRHASIPQIQAQGELSLR